MVTLDSELLKKCITKTDYGLIIKVMVVPNSKSQGIEGIDEWRGCLKVRVRAQAHKGKANKELIDLLSSSMSVPPSDLTIRSGETSKLKEIEIKGKELTEIVEIITDNNKET